MIRSESTKFGDYLKPKMPKSTSLPVIQVKIFNFYTKFGNMLTTFILYNKLLIAPFHPYILKVTSKQIVALKKQLRLWINSFSIIFLFFRTNKITVHLVATITTEYHTNINTEVETQVTTFLLPFHLQIC